MSITNTNKLFKTEASVNQCDTLVIDEIVNEYDSYQENKSPNELANENDFYQKDELVNELANENDSYQKDELVNELANENDSDQKDELVNELANENDSYKEGKSPDELVNEYDSYQKDKSLDINKLIDELANEYDSYQKDNAYPLDITKDYYQMYHQIDSNPSLNQNNLVLNNINNEYICRLIKLHFKYFYDYACIPLEYFEKDNWNISKVLKSCRYLLFYNRFYMTANQKDKCNQVYKLYHEMLEHILSKDSKLCSFLSSWTDTTIDFKWIKKYEDSYLRTLLNTKKYRAISPAYIVDIYYQYINKSRTDNYYDIPDVRAYMKNELNDTRRNMKYEINNFINNYEYILQEYVFRKSLDNYDKNILFRQMIDLILGFSEKLIKLNVYNAYDVITDIINHYLPLDEIFEYDSNNFVLV